MVADGGTLVFSSAAADVIGTDDVFHINAQSEDYWLTLFAENGFSKTADDLSFICPWAIALRKASRNNTRSRNLALLLG